LRIFLRCFFQNRDRSPAGGSNRFCEKSSVYSCATQTADGQTDGKHLNSGAYYITLAKKTKVHTQHTN